MVVAVLKVVVSPTGVPMVFVVIGISKNWALPPVFPQTYKFPLGFAALAEVK